MPARLHPGVYVEEIPSGARSIEGAGTSTTIFVGQTERGPLAPTKIKGKADYERQFGGYERDVGGVPASAARVEMRYAMDAFFANGGTTAYILRAIPATVTAVTGNRTDGSAAVVLDASSPGKWSDSVQVRFTTSSYEPATRFKVEVWYRAPSASTASLAETFDRLTFDSSDENYAPDVLLRSLYVRWGDGVTVPAAGTIPTLDASPVAMAGGVGGDATMSAGEFSSSVFVLLDEVTDAGLLVCPARFDDTDSDTVLIQQAALDYAEARARQDIFCIADMPRQKSSVTPTTATSDTVTDYTGMTKTNFGAVYFPWVEISDPIGDGRDPTLIMGPSAFLAGLYGRTDQRRGVWKAPAGLEATVLGVRKIEYKLLDTHQDDLNPLGINALRSLPQGGNVVWGSRTMVPSSEWRYVPVRRTAIFLRTSIYNGIQWAVFEPNDEQLWSNLRLAIGGFMEQLFRQGAFAGATSRDAYFVKCDAETTPEIDQIAGVVNVWVGFSPLRPAEFVVVKLSQIVNQKA